MNISIVPGQNKQLSKNFTSNEFLCPDGCSGQYISSYQVQQLQTLRNKLGKSIKILSGFRCAKHNKAIGGKPNSQHLFGRASDIQVAGMTANQLDVKAKGLFDWQSTEGKKLTLHVDTRNHPQSNPVQAPVNRIYVVKKGDTFSGIAKRLGTDMNKLKSKNPQIKNINILNVGDKINY
jgi:LysM repeat protein